MNIFDGHSDLLVDLTNHRLSGEMDSFRKIHLPKLRRGGVNGLIAVIWIDASGHSDGCPCRMNEIIDHSYAELTNLPEVAFPVKNIHELHAANESGKIALILGIEGLEGLDGDPEKLYTLHQKGLRHASLTWNLENPFATGAKSEKTTQGITPVGKRAVEIIEELDILLDVSHANEKTFWDIAGIANGPMIASHSNVYNLCPHPRNLKDDQIKRIKDSGGLIGLNTWREFIHPTEPTIDHLLDHLDYLVDMVGIDHVFFGFDFTDYLSPDVLSSPPNPAYAELPYFTRTQQVPDFIAAVKKRGYTHDDLQKISYLNIEKLFARLNP